MNVLCSKLIISVEYGAVLVLVGALSYELKNELETAWIAIAILIHALLLYIKGVMSRSVARKRIVASIGCITLALLICLQSIIIAEAYWSYSSVVNLDNASMCRRNLACIEEAVVKFYEMNNALPTGVCDLVPTYMTMEPRCPCGSKGYVIVNTCDNVFVRCPYDDGNPLYRHNVGGFGLFVPLEDTNMQKAASVNTNR